MASLLGFLILLLMAVAGLAVHGLWLAILIGLIPAAIASSKGARSFVGWWGFGAALFIVALPLALMRRNEKQEEMRKLVASIAANTGRDRGAARDDDGAEDDDDDVFETYGRAEEYSSWVAGLVHRPEETLRAVRDVRAGEILALRRDPFHPVDPRAVEVYWRGRQVGYVPARHAGWVSERMDAGRPISAFVDDVARNADGSIARIGTSLRLVSPP